MHDAGVPGEVRFTRSPEADATMAGDRAAIFHRGTRVAITLNPTGTLLWNSLDPPKTEEELVQTLTDRFGGVPQAQLQRDTRAFLEELASHGMLQPG